jgi:hypothetical protein
MHRCATYGGLKSEAELLRKREQDATEMIKVSWMSEGKGQNVELSRAQIRSTVLEWNQEAARKHLEFGSNKYTEKTIEAMKQVLTPQDFKFMRSILDTYRKAYDVVNVVYKGLTGRDLRMTENYTKYQLDHATTDPDFTAGYDALLSSVTMQVDPTARSEFRERMGGAIGLIPVNDFMALEEYIQRMVHFAAFAKLSKDLDLVFKTPVVRDQIKRVQGDEFLATIDIQREMVARGNERGVTGAAMRALEKASARWTLVRVSAPKQVVNQAVQVFGFMQYGDKGDFVPPHHFVAGMLDVIRAMATGETDIITGTPFYKMRGADFIREYQQLKRAC